MNTVNAKNRGYFKIESATRAFNFDFKNKVVLDIGSSTGGFTQYALDHGATKVIAVEKGTNQMVSPLRFDPRIELHEKTDIFDIRTQTVPSEGLRSAAARGRAPAGRGPRISEIRIKHLQGVAVVEFTAVHYTLRFVTMFF